MNKLLPYQLSRFAIFFFKIKGMLLTLMFTWISEKDVLLYIVPNNFIVVNSLEEECAVSSCSASLESKNMDLHASLKHLTAVFNKLDTYVGLLAAQSK